MAVLAVSAVLPWDQRQSSFAVNCSFGRKTACSFMCSKLYSHVDSGGEQFCSFIGSFGLEQFHILKTVFSYTQDPTYVIALIGVETF